MPSPGRRAGAGQVAATSVNLSDWEGLRGSPAYARIGGLRAPARRILGSDIAGVVDEVGDGVTRFQPGDEVYGDNLALKGGFAEYALAPEDSPGAQAGRARPSPRRRPSRRRARSPCRARRRRRPGCRVLVNGAGGGSGSFAIQLAKRLGAHVTGVDNAAKLDFMRSVGADEVIDYRRDDFTRTDAALRPDPRPGRAPVGVRLPAGAGARRPLPLRRRVGAHAAARGSPSARWSAGSRGRSIGVLAVREGPAHFEPLADLCVAGDVRIHIDRTFALDEVPAALARVGEGRALGKVVVTP